MSDHESEFLKKLQQTLWTAFAGLLLLLLTATVPFYFNTKKEIQYLKEEQAKKADKAIYELIVREIQKDIAEINAKLDRKQDKQPL